MRMFMRSTMSASPSPGRDARPGRRIRLRQVDAGAPDHAPARSDRRQIRFERREHRRDRRPASSPATPTVRRIQMVFQDAGDSLNPRFTAARCHRRSAAPPAGACAAPRCARGSRKLAELMRPADRAAWPLSAPAVRRPEGARRHRARHRAEPELLILDEPTAALDVSVQVAVLKLLQRLKADWGMSYLFVSARPERRAAAVRPRGGDVSRRDRRDRAGAERVRRASAPVHAGADRRDPALDGVRPHDARLAWASRAARSIPTRTPAASMAAARSVCERCAEEMPALRERAPGRQVACHFA